PGEGTVAVRLCENASGKAAGAGRFAAEAAWDHCVLSTRDVLETAADRRIEVACPVLGSPAKGRPPSIPRVAEAPTDRRELGVVRDTIRRTGMVVEASSDDAPAVAYLVLLGVPAASA